MKTALGADEPPAPLCKCHGEPMYASTNNGGWICAVKKRQYQRDRYDADPIHRLGKNLHDAARKRRLSHERRADT